MGPRLGPRSRPAQPTGRLIAPLTPSPTPACFKQRLHYNANGDNWWAVDDVFLIGTGTFACDVFGDQSASGQTPLTPGTGTRP